MSTETGLRAEAAAVEYLKNRGFKIISQNWRNRFCEIDVVAKNKQIVHFVEVKYRKSTNFGEGFEYITPEKMRRLKNAAQAWLAENEPSDVDYQVDVISVGGPPADHSIAYLPNAVEA